MKQEKQKIYEEPRIKVVHFMVEGGFGPSGGGSEGTGEEGGEGDEWAPLRGKEDLFPSRSF